MKHDDRVWLYETIQEETKAAFDRFFWRHMIALGCAMLEEMSPGIDVEPAELAHHVRRVIARQTATRRALHRNAEIERRNEEHIAEWLARGDDDNDSI